MQGDVFEGVTIPGSEPEPGPVMILTHPCSMRRGAELKPRLLVARVSRREPPLALPWKGHYSILPLPDLMSAGGAGEEWRADFEEIGMVSTSSLDLGRRVACLDDLGISLLNQRHAHFFTRYVVETVVLYEQAANVLIEAELMEDWIDAAVDAEDPEWEEKVDRETRAFDEFLAHRRDLLKDVAQRSTVRRAVRDEIRRRATRSVGQNPPHGQFGQT